MTMISQGKSKTEHQTTQFIDWAKENAVPITSVNPLADNDEDLEAIVSTIGEAQVVALSEGCHNSRQMMSLHHRIVKYLIEHCGFTIVATESGLPESKLIWDYVQNKGAGNDTEQVYKTGLNKMYSEWKEGRDLIEWMRNYNISNDNKLQYYGIDIGGFYQNWKRPMDQILRYLKLVDGKYAKELTEQLQPFLNILTENARINYSEKLSPLDQAKLAIILEQSVDHFNTHEQDYVSQSNQQDFDWARQSMISMQLAEHYYRNYLDRSKNGNSSRYPGLNGREVAMQQNLLWILETQQRERPTETVKIIWINHVIHTKTETQYQDKIWGHLTPAGQMICQALGPDKVFIIGLVYGGGRYWKGWQNREKRSIDLIPSSDEENGIEAALSAVGVSQYFIHWEKLSKLNSAMGIQFLMSTFSMRENDYFIKIRPAEWNACIYLSEVDPATPHPTTNKLYLLDNDRDCNLSN
eukprot:GFUD01011187.1.p1 GENE.GFUD01011187.1~~GFUD01011187.1.p1  ORF type:complete len:474 (+),score=89.91 GFUD01011187.1:24-1424(+)